LKWNGSRQPSPSWFSEPAGRQAATAQPLDTTMFGKIIIALTAAIVVGASVMASAAATHHRVTHAYAPANAGSEHIITNQCLPTDNPCRTQPDGW
jgi:hypothetical protein